MEFAAIPKGLSTTQTITQEEFDKANEAYYQDDRIKPIRYDEPQKENWISRSQENFRGCCQSYSTFMIRLIIFAILAGYTVYFVFAILHDAEAATALIVITGLTVFGICWVQIRDRFGDSLSEKCFDPLVGFFSKRWGTIQWFFYPAMVILIIWYMVFVVIQEVRQVQSLSGFVFFFIVMLVTSKHPTRIRWRPVIWGYTLQFIMAIVVLRWPPGYEAVRWISALITRFINFALDGAAVVFGDPMLVLHPFAFMGMPMLIYTGAVMALLYYVGLTQLACMKMAWLMKVTMGTTAIETLGAASNIFLHGMDTMLMLRPYLDRMTKSEFNCFQVGAHCTIAGFIFGLFVLFGAPPQHLLSAAVMSAPAAIAIAKLNYPETKVSILKDLEDVKLSTGDEVNLFEAAANGAEVAGKTVFTVIINYIAFLGLLACINAILAWMGELVGFSELSFEWMCSYVMFPIALMIGVEMQYCREVAKLIGIKVFASEVLAFQEIGRSANAGLLDDRSEALATYSIAGFASISTLAIAVGVWNAVCPQRTKLMASLMLRVLTEANIACFTTACVAGMFYSEEVAMEGEGTDPISALVGWILGILPSYANLMSIVEF